MFTINLCGLCRIFFSSTYCMTSSVFLQSHTDYSVSLHAFKNIIKLSMLRNVQESLSHPQKSIQRDEKH